MSSTPLPATAAIRDAVLDELAAAGGTEMDCHDDGRRLFLRTLLPKRRRFLRRRDAFQPGVAVMAAGLEIRVHPFVFREVCRNGAILAQAIETRLVRRVPDDAPQETVERVVYEIREAVRVSASPVTFAAVRHQIKSTMQHEADFALHLMPLRASLPAELADVLFDEIFRRFQQEEDGSLYGLMNAVTSVARDQRDPEVRWRTEELGGGVAALLLPTANPGGVAAAAPVG